VKCVKFNEFSNSVARYSPENNFVRCIKIIMQTLKLIARKSKLFTT